MSTLVKLARRMMWLEFKDDPALRRVYTENIACVIMDFDRERMRDFPAVAPMTASEREVLATRIFEHLFKEE